MSIVVLVAEDDTVTSMALKYALSAADFTVVEFSDVESATHFLNDQMPDLAVLAPTLGLESSSPIAFRLKQNNVPLVWVSDGRDALPKPYRKGHLVSKPFTAATLLGSLMAAYLASHRGYADFEHVELAGRVGSRCPNCESATLPSRGVQDPVGSSPDARR
jgi:DNA-binding response OmpR family regulator